MWGATTTLPELGPGISSSKARCLWSACAVHHRCRLHHHLPRQVRWSTRYLRREAEVPRLTGDSSGLQSAVARNGQALTGGAQPRQTVKLLPVELNPDNQQFTKVTAMLASPTYPATGVRCRSCFRPGSRQSPFDLQFPSRSPVGRLGCPTTSHSRERSFQTTRLRRWPLRSGTGTSFVSASIIPASRLPHRPQDRPFAAWSMRAAGGTRAAWSM